MYCPQCGNILPDNAGFCNKCGSSTGVEPQSDGVGPGGNRSRVARIVVIAVIVVALIVTGVLVVPRVVSFVSSHIASSYDPDEFVDELQDASDVVFSFDADSDEVEEAAEDFIDYALSGCSKKGLKGLIEYVDDEWEDCDDEDELIEVLVDDAEALNEGFSSEVYIELSDELDLDEYDTDVILNYIEISVEFDVGDELSSSEIRDAEDCLEHVYDIDKDIDEAVWIEVSVEVAGDADAVGAEEDLSVTTKVSDEDIFICKVGRHWYVCPYLL